MRKKKNIFIGSSTQALKVAERVEHILRKKQSDEFKVTLWTDNVFSLNKTFIESIFEAASKNSDFAIFIFAPDDIIKVNDNFYFETRSNVIFEYGLFTGTLNRDRVFVISPSDIDNFKIPSDLLGVTTCRYKSRITDEDDINEQLKGICDDIIYAIKKVKSSDANTIIGHYSGPREYYEIANKNLLNKDLSEIILIQKTSSLLYGYQRGSNDEKLFLDLVLNHLKNNTEFIHFTKYTREEDSCNSYIQYKKAEIKKEIEDSSKRPIKKFIGENFPAPIMIVVPKDTQEPFEGIFLSYAGVSGTCLHIRGNMLKEYRKIYRSFYFDECEIINI